MLQFLPETPTDTKDEQDEIIRGKIYQRELIEVI